MGRPVTVKPWVALRPQALLTVATMRGVVPELTQAGAVQGKLLLLAPEVAVPDAPTLAAQEKASAEPAGSLASTPKVSTWPAVAVGLEREALVIVGGARGPASLDTHNPRRPVFCPPRPSFTSTLSWQLLHVVEGRAEGVKIALAVVAPVKLPAQGGAPLVAERVSLSVK